MAPQKVTYKYSIGYSMIGPGNCTLVASNLGYLGSARPG